MDENIKCYMQQLLEGLQHCHEHGILHLDIKHGNLMIDRHGVLKIGDFGLSSDYGAGRWQPAPNRVVSLPYRAPELLLGATSYGVGVDLWSAGCLLTEMFFGKTLMHGSGEKDQLLKIFTLFGSPPDDYWRKMNLSPSLKPPEPYKSTTAERFRDLPPSTIGLLATLLALDPAARGTAGQALQSSAEAAVGYPGKTRCPLKFVPGKSSIFRPVLYYHIYYETKLLQEQMNDPCFCYCYPDCLLCLWALLLTRVQDQEDDEWTDDELTDTENSGQEPVTNTGNPGQEPAAANSSSSAHESSEKTIVNASSSTVAKRFSASPVVQEASPVQKPAQDQKQLPTANASHSPTTQAATTMARTTTWSRLRATMEATTAWRRRRPKASRCPVAAAAP
ncbi:probable serine/threonine-protein kinase At1g54610 isoform X2 [Miscanthus floridulus]|uniref:probable serine/threonine-protein kinase At1g54610 isoform X2 n=1 Tax=Miscanthus floridulus TaxID=154761 RepID=UPI00345A30F9